MSPRPRTAVTTAGLGALVLALSAAAPATATAASGGDSTPPKRHLQRAATSVSEHAAGSGHVVGRFRPAADGMVDAVVEMSRPAVAVAQRLPGARRLAADERASVRSSALAQQGTALGAVRATGARVQAQLADAINGVRVRVKSDKLAELARIPGVVAVRSIATYTRDNTKGDTLVTAPQAWGDVGATGKGITIAVIDAGVDYYHADFGGSGNPADFTKDDSTKTNDIDSRGQTAFPNSKVVGGYDFAGNAYNASTTADPAHPDFPPNPTPKPDPDPLPSCSPDKANVSEYGHGTHVSGTAAGQGVTSDGKTYTGPYDATTLSKDFTIGPGTAPEARILAYRVFGCVGSTNLVVDALDRAVKDGANVINMSLGSDYGLADSADAVASDNASLAGVTVVASAGNPGQRPYLVGSPAVSTRAISVAASDANVAFAGASISTSPATTAINANGAPLPVTGTIKVLTNADGSVALGCTPEEFAGAAGFIVVTKRGVCARVARAQNGQKAGAKAVIMINSDKGYPPVEGPIDGVTIPFLGARGDGASAKQLVAADGTSVTITAAAVSNPSYKALAGFTAGGPRIGDSALKPDITAPGVGTISARAGSGTGSLVESGTSMASPTTAGVAADVLSKRPGLTPAQVKGILMSTADPAGVQAYDPRTAGAGLVQARRAVDAATFASVADGTASVSFGYRPQDGALSVTKPLTISNLSSSTLTCDLSSSFTGDAQGATLALAPSSITLPAGVSRQVNVTISMSAAAVAALPAAEPASGNGSVTSVAGSITATPRTSGAGVYPLHTPFLLVPRGLSSITPDAASPYVFGAAGTATTTVPVSNTGVHAGRYDVYALQIRDPQGNTDQAGDIRNVGITQFDDVDAKGNPTGDKVGEFLVNMYGAWSTPGQIVTDVSIDTTGDGKPDYLVEAVDGGIASGAAADGTYVAFTYAIAADGTAKALDAFNAEAPANSSTMGLPFLASDLGRKPGSGPFTYSVTTSSIQDGSVLDTTEATGRYDVFNPPVTSGDSVVLQPGESATQQLTVNTAALANQPTLGWLFGTFDDAQGGAQTDEVPLQDVTGLTPVVPEAPYAALLLLPALGAVALVLRRRRAPAGAPAA